MAKVYITANNPYKGYAIFWFDCPYMERRGGISSPYQTRGEAEAAAHSACTQLGYSLTILDKMPKGTRKDA